MADLMVDLDWFIRLLSVRLRRVTVVFIAKLIGALGWFTRLRPVRLRRVVVLDFYGQAPRRLRMRF